MSGIIALFIGLSLGMPLGWAVLFCAMDLTAGRKSDPPTKEEWKVM